MGSIFSCLFVLSDVALVHTNKGGSVVLAADVQSEQIVPGEFTGDLRDLPKAELTDTEFPPRVTRPPLDPDPYSKLLEVPVSPIDPLLERERTLLELQGTLMGVERAFSPPDLNFPGIPYQGGAPPDTVGEVGSNHYIQMTNASVVQIYDKNGILLAGPVALDSLWTGGGGCANGRGDPIVLYDELADRWLMSEFASAGNILCVYISMTADPVSGGWYNYAFPTPNFPDYPKYGVWPDAYYVSSNESSPAVYALDRNQMLLGNPATSQRFTAPPLAGFGFQALIPSDLDGSSPPAGSPNFFMRHRDDEVHNAGSNDSAQDFLEIWEFSVDFATPANSTFTQVADIPVAEFDSDLCGLFSFFCFPQPGTATTLDPLREVIMWRLQYRNFGTYETLVGNFVTDVTGTDQGGIRWFELRRSPSGAGAWTLFQEGTYSPDADNRWMGSIAMDKAGGIALGYSVSSATTFPSIRYTGRNSSDPLGTMPLGEVTAVAGMFSQTSVTRWGDYSSMNVDPVDGCTFWYTNEFVGDGENNGFGGTGRWATQILRFTLPDCPIEIDIDVKAFSNPNGFNCKKKGVLPVTIWGMSGFDVSDIDISTVALKLTDDTDVGGPVVNFLICDRGDPEIDQGSSMGTLVADCYDAAGLPGQDGVADKEGGTLDGFNDIDVHFDAQTLIGNICTGASKRDIIPTNGLVITGELDDGTKFISAPFPDIGIDQLIVSQVPKP
jgi:hypothetical protein